MNQVVHRFSLKGNGINIGLCVSTGQVFRWRREGNFWVGAIGSNWWKIKSEPLSSFQSSDSGHVSPVFGEQDVKLYVESNAGTDVFARVFGTDRGDSEWFRGVLKGDPSLIDAVKGCSGLRFLQQNDPVEVLFSFICSANNHIKRIENMVQCLAEFGDGCEFPSVSELSQVDSSYLRSKGFGYRAERIPACAKKILEFGGVSWLADLKVSQPSVAMSELQKLPGVGPKVSECVALFGLNHRSVVPVDTHIWNAVRRRYIPSLGECCLTHNRRKQVGDYMRDRFGEEAGLAHLVLFVDEMKNWRARR